MQVTMLADLRILPHIIETFKGTEQEVDVWVAARKEEMIDYLFTYAHGISSNGFSYIEDSHPKNFHLFGYKTKASVGFYFS